MSDVELVPEMAEGDNTWQAKVSDREVNISLKHCCYICL